MRVEVYVQRINDMDKKEINDFVICLYETYPKLALDIADKILVVQQDREVA